MSDQDVIVTTDGLAALQAELDDLEGPRRREVADRIKTARGWGDLSENSEYHDAKNDQAHLETRIARLRERISRAVVVDEVDRSGQVAFGTTVTVVDDAGLEQTWQLVSSHEASPAAGRLSVDSPVAQSLIGLRPGDKATVRLPRGERRLTVRAVR
jgi:transcription elongation factor GreA